MKTENEIKSLPLEEQQKLVLDLGGIPVSDKYYAHAQNLIKFIKGLKGWKEPALVEVKNIAGHMVTVDGKVIEPDATAKIYPWQFSALGRFLEKAGAAALLLFACLLALPAAAQNQPYVLGAPGQYNVIAVGGFNGSTSVIANASSLGTFANFTNNIVGTNNFTVPVFITNSYATPSWITSNGTQYVTWTTNNIITTNVPGVVSMVNYDSFSIYVQAGLMGSGTTITTNIWDVSNDGQNWLTNFYVLQGAQTGTAPIVLSTNITGFQYGYLRCNTLFNPASPGAGDNLTNVLVYVSRKPNRTGP